MAKRQKKVLQKGITQAEFQDAIAAYAKADAKIANKQSKLDEKIAALREKEAPELTKLEDEKEVNFNKMHAYCEEHPELFEKKKSMETAHGSVGYRIGTPKLKTLRGFTWAAALNLIKKQLPDYVRTKEEPNKEAILANRAELGAEALKDVGIQVVKDETFFVQLKKEEAEAVA